MSMGVQTIRTEKRRQTFLEALAATGNVTAACQVAGMSRVTAYAWRNVDEDLATAWKVALDIGTDALEDEAVRRGTEGYEKPVFHLGKQIATVREYSDVLLMFMLNGRRPEKFRARASVDVTVTVDLAERLEQGRKRVISG